MSRKTNTIKALVVAGALTGSVVGVGGSAQAAAMTLTKVGPAKVALKVEAPLTLTGTNFDSTIASVQFGADADCASSKVVVINSTTAYVTAPTHADCVAGFQDVKLLKSDASALASLTATPTTGANTVKFVQPVDTSATALFGTNDSGIGGSPFTLTGLASVPAGTLTATLGGQATTLKLDGTLTGGVGNYTGTVPVGLAPGAHKLVVTGDGVKSAESVDVFNVKSSIKVTPNVFVKGATAPKLVISGLGFKPAGTASTAPVVKVCGVTATATTGKTATDTAIYVDAPAFAAVTAGATGVVDATTGGVCMVTVSVDADGTGTGTTTVDSVVTAGSTFTYAAF